MVRHSNTSLTDVILTKCQQQHKINDCLSLTLFPNFQMKFLFLILSIILCIISSSKLLELSDNINRVLPEDKVSTVCCCVQWQMLQMLL